MTQATDGDWVPTTDTFASRLILTRHKMGWNAKEAALACGISQASWRSWEVFGVLPRDLAGVCNKIHEGTGVNAVWLMTGIQVGPPPGDGGGPAVVRHQGLEPRTRWLSENPSSRDGLVLLPTG